MSIFLGGVNSVVAALPENQEPILLPISYPSGSEVDVQALIMPTPKKRRGRKPKPKPDPATLAPKSSSSSKRQSKKTGGKKPFKCSKCGKGFKTKGKLNEHNISHTKEVRFFCKFCDYRTWHRSHYNRHMLRHAGS